MLLIYFLLLFFFFFNDTATTEIYTLSLHDALPIGGDFPAMGEHWIHIGLAFGADRKSTRLNSSHMSISYAVFCLKKKKKTNTLYINQKKKNRKNHTNKYQQKK